MVNTGIGYSSLSAVTTGNNNVAVGRGSAGTVTTGSSNVVIGRSADVSSNAASNQIVIGHNVAGHGDNITVIGNTNNTAWHPSGR